MLQRNAALLVCAAAAPGANLLRNGDFASLEGWTANETLARSGRVRQFAAERTVEITNPLEEQDGVLSQTVAANGHRWFRLSARAHTADDGRGSLAVIARDAQGRNLRATLPFRIGATRRQPYERTVTVPEGTVSVEVAISAVHGVFAVAGIALEAVPQPQPPASRAKPAPGQGLRWGAAEIPVQAPGAKLVLQGPFDKAGREFRAIVMDPAYLANAGVRTTLRARRGRSMAVEDLLSGETLRGNANGYPVTIPAGAFRLLKVTFGGMTT